MANFPESPLSDTRGVSAHGEDSMEPEREQPDNQMVLSRTTNMESRRDSIDLVDQPEHYFRTTTLPRSGKGLGWKVVLPSAAHLDCSFKPGLHGDTLLLQIHRK